MNQHISSLSFREYIKSVIAGVVVFRWCTLRQLATTLMIILTKPSQYWAYSNQLSSVGLVGAGAFIMMVVKFSLDPMQRQIASTITSYFANALAQSPAMLSAPLWLMVVIAAALSGIIGSYWIPIFWHTILSIPIERTVFLIAMIRVFCVSAILFDSLSVLWMPLVINKSLPFWLPELLRTALITYYSWRVGNAYTAPVEN